MMTIKEIVEITRANEKTIREKIKELYPGLIKKGKKTILNDSQVENVLIVLKKTGIIELGKSSDELGKSSDVTTMNDVLTSLNALIQTVTIQSQNYEKRFNEIERVIENKIEDRKILLPAPKKSDRDNLNQIIRSYAKNNELNFGEVWGKLYQEVYYRLNINLKIKAKNKKLSIIDFAENEGLLPELLSIALEVF